MQKCANFLIFALESQTFVIKIYFKGVKSVLSKIKIKPFNKGFIGEGKNSDRAPYREKKRKSENKSYGKESSFITPDNPADIEKCQKGIKR